MIQVCSSCGTRWNVRDKQRSWCPRCQGALLPPGPSPATAAPSAAAPSRWGRQATRTAGPTSEAPTGQLPPGYRWIAVRPGAPPPPRPRGRHRGPTPRYSSVPRWGLFDTPATHGYPEVSVGTRPPVSPRLIARVLRVTTVVFGVAALIYVLRYGLLLLNRTMLLPPMVAGAAVVLSILASLAALAAMITCWVILTRWLIERRAAAYAHRGRDDPREKSALWLGCLVPLANLFWAPVYVIEVARLEGLYTRLRRDIVAWWLWWLLSALASTFAVIWVFSFDWYFFGVRIALNRTAQGIADNTVAMICAYLIAMATVLALARVYRGFEGKPVERHAHRWVVVADDSTDHPRQRAADQENQAGLPAAVEPAGQEPAA